MPGKLTEKSTKFSGNKENLKNLLIDVILLKRMTPIYPGIMRYWEIFIPKVKHGMKQL